MLVMTFFVIFTGFEQAWEWQFYPYSLQDLVELENCDLLDSASTRLKKQYVEESMRKMIIYCGFKLH